MAPTPGEKQKGKASSKASTSRPGKRKGKSRGCPANKVGLASEDTWNMKEKERLLTGLKTFASTSIHSLSRFVRTKTPQEVQEKITSIRKCPAQSRPGQKLVISDDSDKKRAPLESWLPVVRDLIGQEPTDLSESLSDVIGIIGRTEVPRESFSSKLNWKNVYQYISDLMANRIHLQSLTNLEALVILDVMHNMADTLRTSDTEEQRRLLNLKYKYLMADPQCCPQFSNRDEMVAMALSNDFSSVENEASASSSVASSASSPSTSTLDMGVDVASCSSPSSSSGAVSNVAGPSSSTTPHQTDTKPKTCFKSEVTSSSKTSNVANASSEARHVQESMASNSNSDGIISLQDKDITNQCTSKVSPSNTAWTPESGYCRPRYYTLNPFCIPEYLLDFKQKKT